MRFSNSSTLQKTQCERIKTKLHKPISSCFATARWLSPVGIWTNRRIKVCDLCKKELTEYYLTKEKIAHFEKLELVR